MLRFALAPIAALILTFSGCGGADDGATAEKPAEAPRMTEQQLVKKMEDVCQEHIDRQVAAVEKYDTKHGVPTGPDREEATPAELIQELRIVILPIVRDTIQDLKRVQPPEQQQESFEAFIEAMEYGVTFTEEKDASWVVPGGSREPFTEAREIAWDMGATSCGQP